MFRVLLKIVSTNPAYQGYLFVSALVGEHHLATVQREHKVFDFSSSDPGDETLRVSRSQFQLELVRLLPPAPKNIVQCDIRLLRESFQHRSTVPWDKDITHTGKHDTQVKNKAINIVPSNLLSRFRRFLSFLSDLPRASTQRNRTSNEVKRSFWQYLKRSR